MKSIIFKIIAPAFFFIFLAVPVSCARAAGESTMFLESSSLSPSVGSEFVIHALLDSSQPLNAYSFGLLYDPQHVELISFDNSTSLIDVWQEQPASFKSGRIVVQGGSIAHFSGTRGNLIDVRFRALGKGQSHFSLANASVYLANGKGTRVIPALKDIALLIGESSIENEGGALHDVTPPQISSLSFFVDPINPTQKLFGFLVRDPGSGVRDVSLVFRSWFFWSEWIRAQNPTVVPPSAWAVRVMVTDNAGNNTSRNVYDWAVFFRKLAFFLGVLGCLMYLGYRERKKIQEK